MVYWKDRGEREKGDMVYWKGERMREEWRGKEKKGWQGRNTHGLERFGVCICGHWGRNIR